MKPGKIFRENPPAPCKDCTERHVGCHSECEKYRAYKAQIARSRGLRMRAYWEDSFERQHKQSVDEMFLKFKKKGNK